MALREYLAAGVITLLGLSAAQAQTDEYPHYPFVRLPDFDNVIALIDGIDRYTPQAFEGILAENPNIDTLILDSGGGSVSGGLTVAERVHELNLNTFIPRGSQCFSACSFIFFAGNPRNAEGELGVHQIAAANGKDNLVTGQYAIADILEVLNQFDVHPNIFSIMFRTPPEDMYVFSEAESNTYGFLESSPRDEAGSKQTTRMVLEPVPASKDASWFVVAGSFPHSDVSGARQREDSLRRKGFPVTLIDTDDYSNFTNGLFAIVVGPTTKAAAQQNLIPVKDYISDAYIKAGFR